MTWLFRSFGLTFESDLPLLGFPPAEPGPIPDVVIATGQAAGEAAAGIAHAKVLPSPAGGHIFHLPEIGAFWVRDGQRIDVSPAEGADPAHIHLYLIGSAIGLLLHQRGMPTLHAATVAREGSAIAFIGDQGAGKSTLAASLAEAGFSVLGDDTMAISETPRGPVVWPGGGGFKLWRDTLTALALSPGPAIANRLDKHFTDNPRMAEDRAHPLGAILLLEGGPHRLERIDPLAAVDLLAQHAYRPEFVPLMGREAAHFQASARLAGAIPVWRFARPFDLSRRHETAVYLGENWTRLTGEKTED
ncbi:MAG: hypothetical protein AAGI13_15090 [Pseudomonadota bacterium]